MYVDNQEEFGYIFDHEKADNIPETCMHIRNFICLNQIVLSGENILMRDFGMQ